jgi:hypothetical protein
MPATRGAGAWQGLRADCLWFELVGWLFGGGYAAESVQDGHGVTRAVQGA